MAMGLPKARASFTSAKNTLSYMLSLNVFEVLNMKLIVHELNCGQDWLTCIIIASEAKRADKK